MMVIDREDRMRTSIFRESILLSLIALLVSGCQFDPYTERYTSVRPESADLAGAYRLTRESEVLIRERRGSPVPSSRITIRPNGAITFRDVPDLMTDFFADSSGALLSGAGTWRIERRQSQWWALYVDLPEQRLWTEVLLIGDKSPYILHFTIGDPDAGDALQFERIAR